MGSSLNTLRGNDMSGDKYGQAPAALKVMVVLLPCRCPNAMPPCCNTGLSLGIDLLLIKLVLLNKEHASLLGAQPSDRIS